MEKHKPEEIAIIGGGLEGCYTALLAAQLRDPGSETGFKYNIKLIEKDSELFNGASLIASRLHLGGEYPLHPQTGKDCIKGAIITALLWGEKIKDIYTDQPPMRFLIANATQRKGKLTLEKFERTYEELREEYARLLKDVIKARGWDPDQTQKALFGAPNKPTPGVTKDAFYYPLTQDEIKPFKDMAGGFQTREQGINVARKLSALEDALEKVAREQKNLEILRGHEVTPGNITYLAKPRAGEKHFEILTLGGKHIFADQLVNAAWDKGPELLQKHIENERDFRPVYAHHRAMLVVDTSSLTTPPPTFIMDPDGEHAGMWAPWNGFRGLLYLPRQAYHGTKLLKFNDAILPPEWTQDLDTIAGRVRYLAEACKSFFSFLRGAEAKRLIVRNTLNFADDLSRRPHEPTRELPNQPGHHVMCATKMTLAAQSAVEAVQGLQARSKLVKEGKPDDPLPQDVYDAFGAVARKEYGLESLLDVNPARARAFASNHDLFDVAYKQPPKKGPAAPAPLVTTRTTVATRSFGQGFGPEPSHHVKLFTEAAPGARTGQLLPEAFCGKLGQWAHSQDARSLLELLPESGVSLRQLSHAVHNRLLHMDAIEMARLMPLVMPYMASAARDALFSEETVARLPPALWHNIRQSRDDLRLPETDDPRALSDYLRRVSAYDETAPIPQSPSWRKRIKGVTRSVAEILPFATRLSVYPDVEAVSAVFPMLFGALDTQKQEDVARAWITALHEAGPEEEKRFFQPLEDPLVNTLQLKNPKARIETRRIFNNGRSLQMEFQSPALLRAGAPPKGIPGISFWGKDFVPLQFHFHRNQNIEKKKLLHNITNDAGEPDGRLEFRVYRNPEEARRCDRGQQPDPNDAVVGELHAIYMHKEKKSEGGKQYRTALALCAHVVLDPDDRDNPQFGQYIDTLEAWFKGKQDAEKLNRTFLNEGEGVEPSGLRYDPLACYNTGQFTAAGLPEAPFASMRLGDLTLDKNGRIVLAAGRSDVFYRGVYAVHLPDPITISTRQLEQVMTLQATLSKLDPSLAVVPLSRADSGYGGRR